MKKARAEGEGKRERSQRLGRCPSRWGRREPVSLCACRGTKTNMGGVTRAPQGGRQANATETWLVRGVGKRGQATLGSYRQSGGANSTRKTWGALVGETGRSQLIGIVTLGIVWGRGSGGEEVTGIFPRRLEKRLIEGICPSPLAPGRMAPPSAEMRNSPQSQGPWPSPPESSRTPSLGRQPIAPAT